MFPTTGCLAQVLIPSLHRSNLEQTCAKIPAQIVYGSCTNQLTRSVLMLLKESPPLLVLFSAYCWVVFFAYISGYTGIRLCLGFLCGFCVYTVNEYIIHYFLFHVVAKNYPDNWWPKRLYYKVHGRHHKFPNDVNRVVLPLVHQWVLVVVLTSFWRLVFIAYPIQLTFLFGSGIMFGYSFYEVAHIYAHGHPVVRHLTFLDVAADYHMAHHRASSRANFGFCSPFCDFANGTLLDRGDLNPFKWSDMRLSFVGFMAGLPLPIPFYHWVFMHLKRHSAAHRGLLKVERFAAPSTDNTPVTDPHLD